MREREREFFFLHLLKSGRALGSVYWKNYANTVSGNTNLRENET